MKNYLNLEGLTRFLGKLTDKFAVSGHTHTKDEITDLQNVVIAATDDGNGNVVLTTDYVAGDSNT